MMNQKERDRLQLFGRVKDGQMTLVEASDRLGLSYRQAKRLWRRYRAEGDAGLVHRSRGRPSNNRRSADAGRERAIGLYREHYQGFGPTLASQQMALRDGLVVDHETLRGWLVAAGLWQVRRDRSRRHRRRRERKAQFGDLVQLDGSDHAWFGEDHPRCCLMVMVDDATGWTWAQFFGSETTAAAMQVLRGWVERHGLPAALYPDCHSIHRRNDKQAEEEYHRTGQRPLTQFGAAMAALGVDIHHALSPQAKGRVERMNGTLQDRLVKLLKLEGITAMEAGNTYLHQTYLPDHNARFAVAPVDAEDAHRPAPGVAELDAALCLKEPRSVGNDGCVRYHGRWLQLESRDALPRRRPRVEVREHLDGRLELVHGGKTLAYTELFERPTPSAERASLSDRVAEHTPPWKPAADHPWRQSAVTPPAKKQGETAKPTLAAKRGETAKRTTVAAKQARTMTAVPHGGVRG